LNRIRVDNSADDEHSTGSCQRASCENGRTWQHRLLCPCQRSNGTAVGDLALAHTKEDITVTVFAGLAVHIVEVAQSSGPLFVKDLFVTKLVLRINGVPLAGFCMAPRRAGEVGIEGHD
jgi:hypothetical protein